MRDFPNDAKRPKAGFFLMLLLVSLGSVAILLPASLPQSPYRAVGEDGAVELLQMVFLLLSAALFLATSGHAGRLRVIFIAFGLGAFCAAIGEYRRPLNDLIEPVRCEWLQLALLVVVGVLFFTHTKPLARFWGLASSQPTTGFLIAGLILAYVFGEAMGTRRFWEASLGAGYDTRIPRIVESYIELLACYFVFVSTLGFCLPITQTRKKRRQPPRPDKDS